MPTDSFLLQPSEGISWTAWLHFQANISWCVKCDRCRCHQPLILPLQWDHHAPGVTIAAVTCACFLFLTPIEMVPIKDFGTDTFNLSSCVTCATVMNTSSLSVLSLWHKTFHNYLVIFFQVKYMKQMHSKNGMNIKWSADIKSCILNRSSFSFSYSWLSWISIFLHPFSTRLTSSFRSLFSFFQRLYRSYRRVEGVTEKLISVLHCADVLQLACTALTHTGRHYTHSRPTCP